jgi:hypothetical protein
MSQETKVTEVLAKCQAMMQTHDYSCLHGLTVSKCLQCRPDRIQHIGYIDALGRFRLHRTIEDLLEETPRGFVDKLKKAKKTRRERATETQAAAMMEGWRHEIARQSNSASRLCFGRTE